MSTAPWRKASICLILVCASVSPTVYGVNDLDLWLPSTYRDLMPQLRKAALAVEATEECEKVMQAGLYEPSRKAEVPQFRLLCRDASRRSYAILVDSNTLDMTFPGRKPAAKGFSSKVIASSWRNCEEQLQRKTRYMKNMVLLTQGMPEPDTSEPEKLKLVVDFDAESVQRQALHYRATCVVTHDKPAILSIKGRPKP